MTIPMRYALHRTVTWRKNICISTSACGSLHYSKNAVIHLLPSLDLLLFQGGLRQVLLCEIISFQRALRGYRLDHRLGYLISSDLQQGEIELLQHQLSLLDMSLILFVPSIVLSRYPTDFLMYFSYSSFHLSFLM